MNDTRSWWRTRWMAWALGLTATGLMTANLALMYVDRNVAAREPDRVAARRGARGVGEPPRSGRGIYPPLLADRGFPDALPGRSD